MKITRKQLRKLIAEAMFSPYAAKGAAKERAAQNLNQRQKYNLDVMLGDAKRDEDDEEEETPDEETLIQGHELLDTIGDYESPHTYKDEQTGEEIKSSYQDIQLFDKDMQDAMLKHKRMQMADEFENYLAAEGPEIMSIYYAIADAPDTDLYVNTDEDFRDDFQAPGHEVVRDPGSYMLMAISPPREFNFAEKIGSILGIDLDGDDMDALHLSLEKMAGDRPMGHTPEGYQYPPDQSFIAWITQNNPNLKIYVDP